MRRARFLLSLFLLSCHSTLAVQNSSSTPQSHAPADNPAKTVGVIAGLSPSVNVLDFGHQAIHAASAPQAVILTNAGQTGLLIKEVTATPGDFGLSQNCKTGQPLPRAGSCTILVRFTPDGAGIRKGKISILAADAAPLEIMLSGDGVESAVALSDTSLVFRDQLVNALGDRQLVRLENHSDTAPLLIKNIVVPGGFVSLPTPDQCMSKSTVAPRGACNLAVAFSPVNEGLVSGTITIEDSDGASPHHVALTGRATAIKLSTPSLVWDAPVAVSTAGATQDVQIRNEGRSPLRIDSIEVRGDFVEQNACIKELAPQQTCVVSVAFQPKSVGRFAGSVKIHDSDVTTIQTVFLAGNGVALELSPSQLDFREQKLESTSSPQTVVLTNHGTTAVSLRSIGVNGDFVIPSKSCGDILASAQSCKVNVSFSPSGRGPRTGRLSIDTGANPQNVLLRGVGTEELARGH